jgi:glycosyltransferase involved in cell wall biosynthesis
MIDSGVTIPVHEIRWGIDSNAFPFIERPDDGIFTFGQYGSLTKRKGTDVLISAFQKAFPPNRYKNVRLLLKTAKNVFIFPTNRDSRIKVQMGESDGAEMIQQFLSKIDCLVFPSRGEGAGLPVPEALSTGIPAIATGWSGCVDYLTNDCGWFINYTMVDAKEFSGKETYNEPCGQWSEPDENHLIQLMRYVYEHQDEARQKGLYGAQWVRENRTWQQSFSGLEKILQRYL